MLTPRPSVRPLCSTTEAGSTGLQAASRAIGSQLPPPLMEQPSEGPNDADRGQRQPAPPAATHLMRSSAHTMNSAASSGSNAPDVAACRWAEVVRTRDIACRHAGTTAGVEKRVPAEPGGPAACAASHSYNSKPHKIHACHGVTQGRPATRAFHAPALRAPPGRYSGRSRKPQTAPPATQTWTRLQVQTRGGEMEAATGEGERQTRAFHAVTRLL